MLVRRFDFTRDPDAPPVGMTTGATIHTTNGLWLRVAPRADLEEMRRREAEAAAANGDTHNVGQHGQHAEAASGGGCPYHAAAAAAAGKQRDVKEVALAFTDSAPHDP
jgi:beta-ring hydroxylase